MAQYRFASSDGGSMGYWLYTPENGAADLPLIVYLHGGSGRGDNLNLVVAGSLPKGLYEGTIFCP